jgi:hypothetical protein
MKDVGAERTFAQWQQVSLKDSEGSSHSSVAEDLLGQRVVPAPTTTRTLLVTIESGQESPQQPVARKPDVWTDTALRVLSA